MVCEGGPYRFDIVKMFRLLQSAEISAGTDEHSSGFTALIKTHFFVFLTFEVQALQLTFLFFFCLQHGSVMNRVHFVRVVMMVVMMVMIDEGFRTRITALISLLRLSIF